MKKIHQTESEKKPKNLFLECKGSRVFSIGNLYIMDFFFPRARGKCLILKMYAELSSGINFTKKAKQNKIKKKKWRKRGVDSYSKKGYFSLQRQTDAFCVWLNTH